MRASQLRHRVISIADEDPLVELGGSLPLAVPRVVRLGNVVGELVEEQPSQSPWVTRVAREQGSLDGFREVDKRTPDDLCS
jgi:hypothetical protein